MPDTVKITDSTGRVLEFEKLDLSEEMNLLAAAGPELSGNRAWLLYARLLTSVRFVDGVPCPFPAKRNDFTVAAKRLGDQGLRAITDHFEKEDAKTEAQEGNASDAAPEDDRALVKN
jgi:hypothetical protein